MKQAQGPCVLVLPTPFLLGENPTPIAGGDAIAIAALGGQERYQLLAA